MQRDSSEPPGSARQLRFVVGQPFSWLICVSTAVNLFLIFTIFETPGFQAEKKISTAPDRDQQGFLIRSDVHGTVSPVDRGDTAAEGLDLVVLEQIAERVGLDHLPQSMD